MNKIIVFQKPNFQGLHREFTSTQKDLREWNFSLCISSIKITGQPWLLCEEANCVGARYVYEEGDYSVIQSAMYIQSLELITEDLSKPKITLYSGEKRSKDFTSETNLTYGDFNDKADSCLAHQGVWLLYESTDLKKYIIVRPAQKKVDLNKLFFGKITSYIKPLKPGKAKITTNVLWDQLTKGDEEVEAVKTLSGDNSSSEETEFVVTSSKTVEATMTYSFNFSTSTSLEISGTIKLIGEVSTSVSNTFTYDTGRSQSETVATVVEVEIPAKIPPKSRLKVNVLRKKYTARVPIEVIIERNNSKSTIMGELVCDSGRTIYAEYNVEDM
ncbi:epidermal differentiation-specific protein-like [Bombina bombina]|uniref:epidermal differentiation-specific protein-like n=1 Tax=Bombina bombina TaxID=8345 RepID=UPI00235B0B2D|nr:epidermal differentiation-specific protein-like [Bombina bombina]